MSYSANYGRGIAYKMIAPVLAVTVAGCAARGRVKTLEDTVQDLKSKVAAVEQKPLAEGPIMVTQSQNPVEFGMLLGQLLNKYRDDSSRNAAEKYANAVAVVPTNDPNKYFAVVMRDTNNDSQPTTGQDRTYPDGTGPDLKTGFTFDVSNLPQQVRDWLLSVRAR